MNFPSLPPSSFPSLSLSLSLSARFSFLVLPTDPISESWRARIGDLGGYLAIATTSRTDLVNEDIRAMRDWNLVCIKPRDIHTVFAPGVTLINELRRRRWRADRRG